MAVGSAPNLIQTPNRGLTQITNGTGTTAQTLYTGGSAGSKITGIVCTSTDTAAQNVQVAIVNSSTTYILGTFAVPAGAGTNGTTPAVSLFAGLSATGVNLNSLLPGLPIDSSGQAYIFLKSASDTITVAPLATITSGKTISVIAIAGDF